MNKNLKWLALGLATTTVIALGISAGFAAAAGPTPTPVTANCEVGGGQFRFGGALVDDVVTKLLGMTEAQIKDLRQQGQSLVQIAATKNVTEKQLVDAMMAYKKTAVQSRVTAGTITQDQANLILKQMEEQTTAVVNRTGIGPMGNGGAGCAGCGAAGTNTRGPGAGGQGMRGGSMMRGAR